MKILKICLDIYLRVKQEGWSDRSHELVFYRVTKTPASVEVLTKFSKLLHCQIVTVPF